METRKTMPMTSSTVEPDDLETNIRRQNEMRKRMARIDLATSEQTRSELLKTASIIPIHVSTRDAEPIISLLNGKASFGVKYTFVRDYLREAGMAFGFHELVGGIELNAIFSARNLRESFDKSKMDQEGFALLMSRFDLALETSLKIGEHLNAYETLDENEKLFHEFMNLIESDGNLHLIHIVVVEMREMKINSLKVVASTEMIKSQPSAGGALSDSRPLKDGYAYNILSLLPLVKGGWLLRQIPDCLLDPSDLLRKKAAFEKEVQRHYKR